MRLPGYLKLYEWLLHQLIGQKKLMKEKIMQRNKKIFFIHGFLYDKIKNILQS